MCTALLVGAETVWTPASANDEECGETSSISTCLDVRNGSINVSSEERRGTRREVELGRQRTGDESAKAAFCRDASDNAAASGGTSPEIVALCHGFAGVPAAVAPGREQVLRA